MTPAFSKAVDPIFLHMVALLDRIEKVEPLNAQEVHLAILKLIETAEDSLASQRRAEWELAKYALVAWIDELLVEISWTGQEWWGENVLEQHLFDTREAYERFFSAATEASQMTEKDAFEVFYVCVILGFRGLGQTLRHGPYQTKP